MKQLTFGAILQIASNLQKEGMSTQEIVNLPVYLGNDDELYEEILGMFCDMYDEKSEELEKFLSEENWAQYTVAIHALKSNALNIGGKKLSELCLKLEKAGKKIKADEETEENISFIKKKLLDKLDVFKEKLFLINEEELGKEIIKENIEKETNIICSVLQFFGD
jgi:HPt (histidine-containing phosphotransfer) domain-containing protein